MSPTVKKCQQCSREYSVQCRSRMERSKYCSEECRLKGLHLSKTRRASCGICGDEFPAKSNRQKFCKACIPDSNARSRYYAYGVDQVMYDAMYFEQDGACLICEETEACRVDHCHSTGRVRGLLCNKCNVALHHVETLGWVERAQAYVTLH